MSDATDQIESTQQLIRETEDRVQRLAGLYRYRREINAVIKSLRTRIAEDREALELELAMCGGGIDEVMGR